MAARDSYAAGTPNWVELGSPDPAGSAVFYGRLFGWSCPEPPPDAAGYRMCTLDGRAVAGFAPAPGLSGERPWWTTYVAVPDADATCRAVERHGGMIVEAAFDLAPLGRMAVFLDPLGAPFSVWQPGTFAGAELVDEPGTFTWSELTTADPRAAKAFYRTVFGWSFTEHHLPSGDYVTCTLDGTDVAGVRTRDHRLPADVPDQWVVHFAVDDTDKACVTVEALGGAVCIPPSDAPGGGRVAVVLDPHGAPLGLLAPEPG